MTICVVIGDDLVGRHAAGQIASIPDSCAIGLRGARRWLRPLIMNVEFVGLLQFGRFLAMMRARGASEVVFAGGVTNSLLNPGFDGVAALYLKRQLGFYIPHSYLLALQEMLRDNGISIRSVVDVFPELALRTSLVADRHRGHDAWRDFAAANAKVQGQALRRLRQSHIVDGGRWLMTGDGTNPLLRQFGRSAQRKSVVAPALCKVAIQPFEDIAPTTVGETTAEIAMANGVSVIIVEAGRATVMQQQALSHLAARNLFSVFVC
jgi:DUF1009 family protein